MKKGVAYYLLHAFTWPMQLFPLEFHYLLSDILTFFVYRVLRYRLSTVRVNLKKSFPEKEIAELKKIERSFYHHFVDIFIETLYLTHISQKRHFKRLVFEGDEVIERLYQEGKSVICVTGHYGNWEFSRLYSVKVKHRLYAIYKKLNSPIFDRFFRDIRSKDGAILLEMRQTYKQLVNDTKDGIPYFAVFIADQRPIKSEIQYWMDFLHQDTPVLLGTEKIARKTNAAVVWAEMQRVKRGYYKIVFSLITDDPASTQPYQITTAYMRMLENAIRRAPEFWLWTHKRWKHQR